MIESIIILNHRYWNAIAVTPPHKNGAESPSIDNVVMHLICMSSTGNHNIQRRIGESDDSRGSPVVTSW